MNEKSNSKNYGLMVIAAVCLHNWLGFGVGWLFARLLGLETAKKRAISIEVGLQNSGLAVGLAGQFANPLCALPAAVATVAHQISGSVLANIYASMPLEKQELCQMYFYQVVVLVRMFIKKRQKSARIMAIRQSVSAVIGHWLKPAIC